MFDVHADVAVCTPRLLEQNGLVATPESISALAAWSVRRTSAARRTILAIMAGCIASGPWARPAPTTTWHAPIFSAAPWRSCPIGLAPAAGSLAGGHGRSAGNGAWPTPPFIAAQYAEARPSLPQPTRAEVFDFLWRYKDLVQHDRFDPRFFQLQTGLGFCIARPDERSAILNPVLSQLEGPANFYDEIELPYDQYPLAKFGRYRAEACLPRRVWRDADDEAARRAA